MTDFAKVFNIYPTESGQDENPNSEHIKRATASKIHVILTLSIFEYIKFSLGISQDFSKSYVRVTIKIPQMRTGLNWRKWTRQPRNGVTTKATYHGTYVPIDFSSSYHSLLCLVECILNFCSIVAHLMR